MNSFLISSGLPHNIWGEAILSANNILNKIPDNKKDATPYELWKCHKPSFEYLKVWRRLAKSMFLTLKRLKYGQQRLILYSLDMLIVVLMHIHF